MGFLNTEDQEVALAAESVPSETRPVAADGLTDGRSEGFLQAERPLLCWQGTSGAPSAKSKKPFFLTGSLSDPEDKGEAKPSHWREEVCSYPKLKRLPGHRLNPALVLNQHSPLLGGLVSRRTSMAVTLDPTVLLQLRLPCSKSHRRSARPFSQDDPCLAPCCWDPRAGVGSATS